MNKLWNSLQNKARKYRKISISELFVSDAQRVQKLSKSMSNLYIDFSKSLISQDILKNFDQISKKLKIEKQIKELLGGKRFNTTEDRMVGHFWLRSKKLRPKNIDFEDVDQTQQKFIDFCEKIRSGKIKSYAGENFKDVINIGIGGSDLGPNFVYEALSPQHDGKINVHFVSNIDQKNLDCLLKKLEPRTTLVVITSKTFTTLETLTNATYIKNWIQNRDIRNDVSKNFVAVSTNIEACKKFGIKEDQIFGFWDWVGGRYSLFSAVGISIVLAYGKEIFEQLQSGASNIDNYLSHKNFLKNPSWIHACINLWNLNFLNFKSLAIIPYSSMLQKFPAFLQQMWMESNGKFVQKDGTKSELINSPVIFGEPGTNSQHSFFQMIQQGNQVIPVDFILIKRQGLKEQFNHHLNSNALAQSATMAFGKDTQTLKKEEIAKELIPHKMMPGNRPSTTIILDELEPYILGQLISFYEQSILIQGLLLQINSFDQFGVELGKKNAQQIYRKLTNQDNQKFDKSTENLIKHLKN